MYYCLVEIIISIVALTDGVNFSSYATTRCCRTKLEAYIFDKIIVHGILKRNVLKTFQVVAIIVQFRIRASKNVSNNFEYHLSWCYMIHLYFARATMQFQSISIILFNDF